MPFRKKVNGRQWGQMISKKGYKCRYCEYLGEFGYDTKADDPAHIIPRGHGGDDIEENGIPLCRKHHDHWDQHKIKMPWDMFLPEEQEYILKKKGTWWKKIDWSSYKEEKADT